MLRRDMSVGSYMTPSPIRARVDTPYKTLLGLLVREGVSAIPVVDEEDRIVGIVTEADLITKEAYSGVRRRALAVVADLLSGRDQHWIAKVAAWNGDDLMTRRVVTCHEDDDIRVVARRMLSEGVKRVPVLDRHGALVGIVSRQDLLRVFDRPDDAIADEVREVLHSDPNLPDGRHVHCQVEAGVTKLTGEVRYEWDVPIVVATVRAVPGVIEVVNQIHAREANLHAPFPPILLG